MRVMRKAVVGDDPNDFVRIEIGVALERDIPVIPILLNGTRMPRADQLPPELQKLTLRNAVDVRHRSFHADVAPMIGDLKKLPNSTPAPSKDRNRRVRPPPVAASAVRGFGPALTPPAQASSTPLQRGKGGQWPFCLNYGLPRCGAPV